MAQSGITRDDLESKFRSFQSDIQGKVQDKKQTLVAAASVGSIVLLLLFYVLGRRSGKKKTTFVEIRRV